MSPTIHGRAPVISTTSSSCRRHSWTAASSRCSPARASRGHGRRRPDSRRPANLPRGPVHPAAAPGARRRNERGPAGDDPRQRARAGAGDRRRLRVDRLQRNRQPPPGRDDARVRPPRPRHARRGDHQPQPPRHDRGDRQAPERLLDRLHAHRWLRGADRPRRHADDRPTTRSTSISPARPACRRTRSTARSAIPKHIQRSA